MRSRYNCLRGNRRPTLGHPPLPARIFASALLLIMTLTVVGAGEQIIVHDITPIFYSRKTNSDMHAETASMPSTALKSDLFSDFPDSAIQEKQVSKVDREQFTWFLTWTHIPFSA